MKRVPKGLFKKYRVVRLGDKSKKHLRCTYFVLDWQHDQYSIPAAKAYADACCQEFPELAHDLRQQIALWGQMHAKEKRAALAESQPARKTSTESE